MLQQSLIGFVACGGYGIGNFRRFSAGNLYVDVTHVSGSGPFGINAGFHQMEIEKKRYCIFIFRTACIMAVPLDLIITFIIGWKIFRIFS